MKGKRMLAGMLCFALLLTAGCGGTKKTDETDKTSADAGISETISALQL